MNRARATGTLLLAALVFVVGLFIGFKLLTTKADTADATPTCTDRTVKKGEKLTSNLVTVSVYNASRRAGLANRVTINLQRKGFLGGTIGNSTSAVKPSKVAILTDDRKDPRVRLVAAQFQDPVTYVKPDIPVDGGVTVVVGDNAQTSLKKKSPISVTSDRAITVCVPVVRLP
jgi:hypothetical protein